MRDVCSNSNLLMEADLKLRREIMNMKEKIPNLCQILLTLMKDQQSLSQQTSSRIHDLVPRDEQKTERKCDPFKIVTFILALVAFGASIAALQVAIQCQKSSYNIFVLQDQRKGDRFLSLSNETQVSSSVLPLNNIQRSISDEGTFNYQIMYLGSAYYTANNFIYDDPVSQFFRATELMSTSHLSISVMLLEAGFNYQLFAYVRSNGLKNTWKAGVGAISSDFVRLTIGARRIESGLSLNQTQPWNLNLTTNNYTHEWSRFSSEVFSPEESALYVIAVTGDPSDYNGYLFDFCLPTIRMWR